VTPVRAEVARQLLREAPRPTPVPAAGNSSSSSNGLFDVVRLAVATQRGAQDDSRRGPAPPQHWGAAEVWPAPSPLRCGQCQEVVAEVACESCHEEFCHWCSAVVHRAGRMRSHQLVPLTGALPGSSGDRALQLAGGLPPSGVAGAARPPVTCQAHPGVAARFFCLDCERDCICAECALNPAGEHRGHRVESARDALVKLDPQIRELLQAAEAEAQDAARAEGVQRELGDVIDAGKRRLAEAFHQLRQRLAEKKTQYLQTVALFEAESILLEQERGNGLQDHASKASQISDSLTRIGEYQDQAMALEIFAQNRTDLVNLMEFSGSPRRHQLAQQVTDMQSQVSDLKLLAADLPRLREVADHPGTTA